MPNHRMLAVAALIVLTIPALGAAAPYLPVVVSTPTPEQLVEGHTVFTVIEVNRTTEVNGTTRFAAAVAVLVREYVAENRAVRFPGVLWFNDQYLVNPQSQNVANVEYRYPCGGAVMAVNRGDPDPRFVLANAYVQTSAGSFGSPTNNYTVVGVTAETGANAGANATFDGAVPRNDPGQQTNQVKTPAVGTVPTGEIVPATEVVPGQHIGASYVETYQIIDPNDHIWVIDRYNGSYRASASTDPFVATADKVYNYPIWVVNILGSSNFIPDDGETNCAPFYDLINQVVQPAFEATNQDDVAPQPLPPWPDPPAPTRPTAYPSNTPGFTYPDDARLTDDRCDGPDGPGMLNDRGVSDHSTYYPTVTDDPSACGGYKQPSRNGYCYGGQSASAGCGTSATPLRAYNALLYFKFEHLRVAGAPRDHAVTSTDTNGCQAGTEWSCPAGGDDAEGNSHPFHPTPHAAHTEAGTPCYATGGGYQSNPNPTNHGGSSGFSYGQDKNGAFPAAGCDYLHATRDIDVYFSPQGRPLRPATTTSSVADVHGSDAPFHDYNTAYGTSEP